MFSTSVLSKLHDVKIINRRSACPSSPAVKFSNGCRTKTTPASRGSAGWGLIGGARAVCRLGSWPCGCSCNGSSGAATCWAQTPSSALRLSASDGNLRWGQLGCCLVAIWCVCVCVCVIKPCKAIGFRCNTGWGSLCCTV